MEAGWSMWLQKLWGAFDSSCCVSEVYKLTSCHGRPPAGSAGELLGGNPHPVCLTSRANVSRARAGEGGGQAGGFLLSAKKILINKTSVSGDLRVLLRVREERCSSE